MQAHCTSPGTTTHAAAPKNDVMLFVAVLPLGEPEVSDASSPKAKGAHLAQRAALRQSGVPPSLVSFYEREIEKKNAPPLADVHRVCRAMSATDDAGGTLSLASQRQSYDAMADPASPAVPFEQVRLHFKNYRGRHNGTSFADAAAHAAAHVPDDHPSGDRGQQVDGNGSSTGQLAAVSPESEALHCICQRPADANAYVGSDGCQQWFHYHCCGCQPDDFAEADPFFCPACTVATTKPTTSKRKRAGAAHRSPGDTAAALSERLSPQAIDSGRGRKRPAQVDA